MSDPSLFGLLDRERLDMFGGQAAQLTAHARLVSLVGGVEFCDGAVAEQGPRPSGPVTPRNYPSITFGGGIRPAWP
jgi:hypothetical protein